MFGLAHASMDWLMAGSIVFIGIMVFLWHLQKGRWFRVACSAAVWFFVFSMHKGSTTGIMTATLAALLFDLFGLPILRLGRKRD